MVTKQLLDVFPDWWRDLPEHPDRFFLVLSDDLDSLLSCRVITKMTGVQVGGFYDFKSLYISDGAAGKEPVFVDAAIMRPGTKIFDNHYLKTTNEDSINPNRLLFANGSAWYNQKYSMSTLLLVTALYDYPVATQAQRDALLCVDSGYKGFYNDDGKYRWISRDWLQRLGMEGELMPTIIERDTKYFEDKITDMKLNRKIRIGAGGLLEGVPGKLPTEVFRQKASGKYYTAPSAILEAAIAARVPGLFSAAQTEKELYKYTFLEGAIT